MKNVSSGKLFCFAFIFFTLILIMVAYVFTHKGKGALAQDATNRMGSVRSLSTVLGELRKKLSAIEKQEKDKGSFYTNANLAILKLKIEKVELLSKTYTRYQGFGPAIQQELKAARYYLKLLQEGKKEPPTRRGMFEMAYISRIDDSAQPYYVDVPADYTHQKAYPLIVYLHGYSPDLDKINWWMPGMMRNEQLADRVEENGYLLACCFGRGNTDFQIIGERDVLDVIDAMKRHYNVDEDRVYLTGLSMGGLGAWTIAAHYPNLFAAIMPVSGRADFYMWQYLSKKYAYIPVSKVPPMAEITKYKSKVAPFQRWLLDGDFGKPLRQNLLNVPVFMLHGENDHLDKSAQSRQMETLLKNMNYTVRYHEFKGGDHWVGYEQVFKDNTVFDWIKDKKRNLWPTHISFKTYTPRYSRAYWVTLNELNEWGKPATVEAEVIGKNSICITTENVAELTLSLSNNIVDVSKPLILKLNNNEMEREIPKDGHITIRLLNNAKQGGLRKRHGITGPIKDAYLSRFIMVYGSVGNIGERRRDKEKAEKAASEWQEYAKANLIVKSDKEITENDVENANLILFGTPKSNAILKQIADKIPIKIGNMEFSLLGRTFKGNDVGIAMIYPNPLNQKRYVVIYSGLLWGEGLPFNHKLDLLPDFIIFTSDFDGNIFSSAYAGRGPNSFLCAGFFDTLWQLNEKLVWYRNNGGDTND